MTSVNSQSPSAARFLRASSSSGDSAVRFAITRTLAVSATRRRLVRRVVRVPLAERAEGAPERAFGRLVVERCVDVRHVEGLAGGRELLDLARSRLDGRPQGDSQPVQLLQGL